MADMVANTRRQLHAEIAALKAELADASDPEERDEIAADLERAEGSLCSLDMCFL